MSVEEPREVPVNHMIPDDLPLLFSDQMVVKHQGGLFILYFFQTRAPLALTPEEMEAVESIEARCIAQIVLTPDQMQRNIAAMSTNFKRQVSKKDKLREEQKEKEDEDEQSNN